MRSVLAAVLVITVVTTVHAQTRPGGKFGFSYPNFAAGAMTPEQFVTDFAALMHNPSAFNGWITAGKDPRRLNPGGIYLKHINVRSRQASQPSTAIEGRPTLAQVQAVNPSWILKDAVGNPVILFGIPGEYMLDFGNSAYLDWIVNTWMPTQLFDGLENAPGTVTWFMHDVGSFVRMYTNCALSDAACNRYNTDEGVISAWEALLAKFKARWPNKKIVINSGPLSYVPVADQMAVFQRVFVKTDGYYGETLTNNGAYWDTRPNPEKRLALLTTMQLAS
ncbi:MAG TPA: hypothetical protein VGL09_06605 [Methylomirabilota bacterium]